jgi:hypothetical protein
MISMQPALPAAVRSDLFDALRWIEMGPGYARIAGVPIPSMHRAPWRRAALVAQIAESMYTHWFARSTLTMRQEVERDEPDIVAVVRAAHAASDMFEGGWTALLSATDGVVVASRGSDRRTLAAFDYANATRPAAPIVAGDGLFVTKRRDQYDADGGWWITWREDGRKVTTPLVRLYWNCGYDGVARLIEEITAAFEYGQLPYTLKCPTARSLFDRQDAVVVYLSADVSDCAASLVRHVHERVSSNLRPSVPPLTRRLGRGLAAAEDPGDGRSFGQSRSAAIADGALRIVEAGITDQSATLAILTATLVAHNISPDRPYLSAGSGLDLLGTW